jgi:N-acetylmuramoyl-L-alanine amidase
MKFSEKQSQPYSKHHLMHAMRHKTSDILQKIKQLSPETGWKLMQYLMLCILLYLCALLPKTGAQKTAALQETAQSQVSGLGVIVLDAGHGGYDPGMIGSSGINEKVLNLVYAKKLQALLEAQGYQVVMTRETEDGLYDADASNKKAQDMQRRVAVIAEAEPLITVSIHQNSYSDASVSGPQVFYFEHSVEGKKLATSIQDAMNEELQIARPRVQKGNTSYYILKRSQSVTVIVECGFLSCPEEEAKLQEETYQDQVAQAICDGILAYLQS